MTGSADQVQGPFGVGLTTASTSGHGIHPGQVLPRRLALIPGPFHDASMAKQRQPGGYEFRAADAFQSLLGEEWRDVDVAALVEEKRTRMQGSARNQRDAPLPCATGLVKHAA